MCVCAIVRVFEVFLCVSSQVGRISPRTRVLLEAGQSSSLFLCQVFGVGKYWEMLRWFDFWIKLGCGFGFEAVFSRLFFRLFIPFDTNEPQTDCWDGSPSWLRIFPECVARFPFHSAGLGVEGVFTTCCATVRNRSWGPYGPAYNSYNRECCKRAHFWTWRFQTLRNLVVAGGTLWHRNKFHNVSKVVLCGVTEVQYGAILLRGFQIFFLAGAALWRPPSSFRVAGAAL